MKNNMLYPGISVIIAAGKWCNPSIKLGRECIRIYLGFVAISFWKLDIERLQVSLANKVKDFINDKKL